MLVSGKRDLQTQIFLVKRFDAIYANGQGCQVGIGEREQCRGVSWQTQKNLFALFSSSTTKLPLARIRLS
jgi:hypothetical protein